MCYTTWAGAGDGLTPGQHKFHNHAGVFLKKAIQGSLFRQAVAYFSMAFFRPNY